MISSPDCVSEIPKPDSANIEGWEEANRLESHPKERRETNKIETLNGALRSVCDDQKIAPIANIFEY